MERQVRAPPAEPPPSGDGLPRRGLGNRHIQFIAIGGSVGAGLFLGSGAAIEAAGPAALLAYAVCGFFVFLMARALGELALRAGPEEPFVSYFSRHLHPVAGFVVGWTYWANWVLVGAAELTAAGLFVRYWYPQVPQWIPVGIVFVGVYVLNIRAVHFFGEAEFWLALAKILAVIGLLVFGMAVLLFPHLHPVAGADISNLVRYGGFAPHGLDGIVQLLPATLFAFGGVEVVALTARETRDPQRTLPRAINGVILRILVFYVGTMFVLMSIAPWRTYSGDRSPFVAVFDRIGIPGAADAVNLVVLTAVISAANTSLFATGRMLSGLAQTGFAPRSLGALNRRGIPARGILMSGSCLLLVVLINRIIPDRAFGLLMATTGYFLLSIWILVMIAHYRMRVRGTSIPGTFRLPGFPVTGIATVVFLGSAMALLVSNHQIWPATAAALTWYSLMVWMGFKALR